MDDITWLNKKFDNITGGFSEIKVVKDPSKSENFNNIDSLKKKLSESIDSLKIGDYEGAKTLLKEAEGLTMCGSCKKLIKRTRVDLDYVKNLCNAGEDDCGTGAENVKKKVIYIRDDYLGGTND